MTAAAAILWASVSEEVDQRLSKTKDQTVTLAPKEWKSGNIPWLVAAMGDERLIKALQQRLQETTLKDRPLKSRPPTKATTSVSLRNSYTEMRSGRKLDRAACQGEQKPTSAS